MWTSGAGDNGQETLRILYDNHDERVLLRPCYRWVPTCSTRNNAFAMKMEGELGLVKENYRADVLVVGRRSGLGRHGAAGSQQTPRRRQSWPSRRPRRAVAATPVDRR
jgi:hypothetical protein